MMPRESEAEATLRPSDPHFVLFTSPSQQYRTRGFPSYEAITCREIQERHISRDAVPGTLQPSLVS